MSRFDAAMTRFREYASLFACPVCDGGMAVREGPSPTLTCAQGHAFDVARQGYVNLLLSHQKHSQDPGYDIETLRARKAMLETGFFDPLTACILDAVTAADLPMELSVLDLGTGEGFVFAKMVNDLAARGRVVRAVGADISRSAIQLACQLDAPVMWCVANLMKRVPFASERFPVIMNILAPVNAEEYRRVLLPGGYLVKVLPQERHLAEIREAIYEHARKPSTSNAAAFAELTAHFTLVSEASLCYQRAIGQPLTENLLHMSPLFWKGKRDRIAQTIARGIPTATVHLSVSVWRK